MSAAQKAIVGLTGGIASGKSTVGQIFWSLGAARVDADAVAREVVQPGSPGLREIVAEFGEEVLAADGSLDRAALGRRVFGDVRARAKLDAITHPRIAARSAELIAEQARGPAPYILYEAALLVETRAYRGLSALIVVTASPETQLARAMARDGLTEDEARARIAAQLPLSQKLAVADYAIDNNAGLAELRQRTIAVHEALLARFAPAAPSLR